MKEQKPKYKVSLSEVFKTIIWPRKKLLFIGLVLIVISRLAGLVLPGASKFLMDNVIVQKDYNKLKMILALIVFSVFVQSVTSYLLTKLLSVEAQHLISELRIKVQKKVLSLPVSFFDNAKSGELVSRIISDVEGVRNLVGTGLVQMVGGLITSVVSLVLLINISPTLTAVVVFPILLFGFISLKAFASIRPIFAQRGKIQAQVTGRLTESLAGVRIVKGFNAEAHENLVFKRGVEELFENIKKSLTSTALVTSSATLLLGITTAAIMGIGGKQIMENQMSFGEFLSFTLYLGFMIAPIVQMSSIASQFTEGFAGLDRTQELLSIPSETDDINRKVVLEKFDGNIEFVSVSYAYPNGETVLKNINLSAQKGSVVALVGSSGAGKSTLAGLVSSFLNPSEGKIFIDGKDLSTLTLDSYRKHLGLVLQDDFLFEGTIEDNILFSNPSATKTELLEAVKSAYVDEFTDRFPEGLKTVIGERGVKLSGGQRQRIAIARAIISNPDILILDEATSNLDTESEGLIQQSLQNLIEGRTTFVIAHRLSTIKKADQILVLEKGEIVERGNHESLIEKKGRYFELFTYQSKI
ncbi:MAG: ABC transporter permease [Flavobacteriaceae bacterium]|nr:MAG: ABC transporter permease [Flavobacteriaceae bacterium]